MKTYAIYKINNKNKFKVIKMNDKLFNKNYLNMY